MANNFVSKLTKSVGASAVAIYTPPTGKKTLLLKIDASNIYSAGVLFSIYTRRSGVNYYIVKDVPIELGATLQETKIVIESTDVLYGVSNTAASVDIVISALEDIQ
jgi:hypothetical protein